MSLNHLVINNVRAYQALEKVHELKTHGLEIHTDFEWKYVQAEYPIDNYVEFTFTDDATLIYYTLLWK